MKEDLVLIEAFSSIKIKFIQFTAVRWDHLILVFLQRYIRMEIDWYLQLFK